MSTSRLSAIRNGAPLVTVVVPCHGEGRYLADCLGSLRSQSYADLEIVVIDDAGSDDSFGVAVDLASLDDRVTVLRTADNVGLGAVRNIVTARARGDLMLYLDGDDWIPPGAIEARVAAFADMVTELSDEPAARIAGVYGDWQHTTYAPCADDLHRPVRRMGTIDLEASRGGNVFIVSAPLVRRDVMVETGGFTEGVVGGEDHLGWLRVLSRGYVFAPCRELVAFYRQKPQSMLRSSTATLAAVAVAGRRHVARVDEPKETPSVLVDSPLARHRSGEVVMRWGRPRVSRTRMAATTPGHDPADVGAPRPAEPPQIRLPASLVGVHDHAAHFLTHGTDSPATTTVTTVDRSDGLISFGASGDPDLTITAGCDAGAVAAALVARVASQEGLAARVVVGRHVRAACHALVSFTAPEHWPTVSTDPSGVAGTIRLSAAGGSAAIDLADLAGLGRGLLGSDGEDQRLLGPPPTATPDHSARPCAVLDATTARTWADHGAATAVADLALVARARTLTTNGELDTELLAVLHGASAASTVDARAAVRTVINRITGTS